MTTPTTSPYFRNDLLAGGPLGWAETIRNVLHIDWTYGYDNGSEDAYVGAADHPMRLTGITFSPSGTAYFSHDDITQLSDYAPHDITYLTRNPNTNRPGLAVLIARMNDTLELWTYELDRTFVYAYTGLQVDTSWKAYRGPDDSRPDMRLPYCRLDVLCDSRTIYYTDMGRTIFRYDLNGAGSQLANFAQLGTEAHHCYASIRVLKPSGDVLVAMTTSGHGPRNALALNKDRTFWADEIHPPDGFWDIFERSLVDGLEVLDASAPPVGITYRPRLDKNNPTVNAEVWSLATWFNPCIVSVGGQPLAVW